MVNNSTRFVVHYGIYIHVEIVIIFRCNYLQRVHRWTNKGTKHQKVIDIF